MKKSIITLMFFACIACDKKNEETPTIQEQTVNAAYRQTTSVTIPGKALVVNVLELKESRCPIDVNCVQAGSADIDLSISDGTNKTNVPVSFKDDNKASGHQTFTLGNQTYSLVIHEVLPHPESTKTPNLEDYKVNLSIEKI